jgi:hypothetical protein
MARRRSFKNETGNRYWRLVVLSEGEPHGKASTWLCRCDCGREIVTLGQSLRSGNTRSCGCYKRDRTIEARSLPSGRCARNHAVLQMKRNANARNLSWSLTEQETDTLLAGDCSYCGREPSNVRRKKSGNFVYSGIDRVNSSWGYEPGNVVSCCLPCNIAKHDMSLGEFRAWVLRVAAKFQTERIA